MSWNTIHIFGFGDVQVNGPDGKTKKATELTKLQAVIDSIWSKKPEDNNSGKSYHAINIFKDIRADWHMKRKEDSGFRVDYSEINQSLIQELLDELMS